MEGDIGEVCLIEGCGRQAKTRGLCKSCYATADKMIRTSEVPSWEWLIEKGLARPANAHAQVSIFRQKIDEILNKGEGQ